MIYRIEKDERDKKLNQKMRCKVNKEKNFKINMLKMKKNEKKACKDVSAGKHRDRGKKKKRKKKEHDRISIFRQHLFFTTTSLQVSKKNNSQHAKIIIKNPFEGLLLE